VGDQVKRITIIGAGFGALTAVRQLRKQDQHVEITVVAPKAEFIYFPALSGCLPVCVKAVICALICKAFSQSRQLNFMRAGWKA
jgi:NADH dehydrogenase FAD-containing subunit